MAQPHEQGHHHDDGGHHCRGVYVLVKIAVALHLPRFNLKPAPASTFTVCAFAQNKFRAAPT